MKHKGLRWLLSLLVPSMLALGFWNLVHVPGFPVAVDRQTLAIGPLFGLPLPAGVQKGDVIDWAHADAATRLQIWDLSPPAGTRVDVPILRDGRSLTASFVAIPLTDQGDLQSLVVPALFFWGLMLVIGLLSLWRGRDAVAQGLALSTLSIVVLAPLNDPAISVPREWLPSAVFLLSSLQAAFSCGVWFGWFWMARALAQPLMPSATLRWISIGFVSILLLRFAIFFAGLWLRLYTDLPPNLMSVADPWLFAARLLPLLALFAFVLWRASGAHRLRAQWVVWSVALLQVNNIFNIFLPDQVNSTTVQTLGLAADLVGGIGLLYASLRHRMIDIAFVLNRAMAFAMLTTTVVGVFALIEHLLEDLAVGHRTGLAIQLGVPLLLGVTLNSVHQRVEHFMERLVFHRRHLREKALTQFAHRAAFIETEPALLAQSVDELMRNGGAPGVAIYVRHATSFQRLAGGGSPNYPETVDVDDPACVVLKANAPLADLETCRSALGASGLVLPMMQQGRLAGFVVCAARPAEDYAPDERELLRRVAHEIGAALRSLRAAQSERLVASLASGALPAEQGVATARTLLERHGALLPPV